MCKEQRRVLVEKYAVLRWRFMQSMQHHPHFDSLGMRTWVSHCRKLQRALILEHTLRWLTDDFEKM